MSRARGELTLAAALASLCPQVEGSMPPSGPSRVPAVLRRPTGGQHLPGAPTWSRAEDRRTGPSRTGAPSSVPRIVTPVDEVAVAAGAHLTGPC